MISKDCQLPRFLVGLDIPRLDTAEAVIIVRRDIANTSVNYRFHVPWCETLGEGELGQKQRRQKYDGESNQKSRTSDTDHRDVRSQVSVSAKRVCYGTALINDPWNGITT